MLTVLYGGDRLKRSNKLSAIVAGLLKKKPGAEVFYFDPDNFLKDDFYSRIDSQGLFEKKCILVISDLLKTDWQDAIVDKFADMSACDHACVVVEESILAPILKKITPHARAIEKIEDKTKTGGKDFSSFALADAYANRSKKSMWIEYQKRVFEGAVPEEIHGMLFWQVKSLLSAYSAKTAEEAGLKPYTFTKAKQALKNFSHDELVSHSRVLVSMYHQAHDGEDDFTRALEFFIVSC